MMLYTAIFFVLLNLSGVIHVEAFNCRFCSKLNLLIDKVDKLLDLEHKGPPSCKEIYDNSHAQGDKAYNLMMYDGEKYPVYCHMSNTGLGQCGGGGWTLVMKMDGSKKTFHYDSLLWSNKIEYGLPEGATGLDQRESKLPTYWNTPFSKICLAMKVNGQLNSILLEKSASSLYSLIADGEQRNTSLGRNKWESLVGQGSLQPNCNIEGFNSIGKDPDYSKARIGIIGNTENDCNSCDSRIGFGTGGAHDDSNTCGNEAGFGPDHGDKHIKAMGYILVQ